MSDILGNDIKSEDIVIYAKREDRKQTIGIGIVIDPHHQYGRESRIEVIPISSVHARAKQYKVKYNIMSAGSPVVHLNDYQIMVVTKPAMLPEGLVNALKNAMQLRDRAIKSAEAARAANRKLTPGERFNNHILDKKIAEKIEKELEINGLQTVF